MIVAVYNPVTGEIARIVECPPAAAELQAMAGEAVVEVGPEIGDRTHRIVNGAPVTAP